MSGKNRASDTFISWVILIVILVLIAYALNPSLLGRLFCNGVWFMGKCFAW